MDADTLRFRAALSRFAVGAVALVLLPAAYPMARRHAWVWIAYLAFALVQQVLISRHIGGRARATLSGLVDVAVLTFAVHTLGSCVTPMTSLYLFAGVANALVVDPAVAFFLAAVGPIAFDALVIAESSGALGYAVDVPAVAAMGAPGPMQSLVACLFITIFVPACTFIVASLVRGIQRREGQLVNANKQLQELSQLDPLTNLYNRRHLFASVETELARVRRGHPLAIVMLDLDRFKTINDTQGHLRGDVLLKEIATALASTTREVDVAGRYGGDEFIVVLPDTDLAQARKAAERMAQSVRAAALRFDATSPVTASLGIAIAEAGDTVAALLRRADENAYAAKKSGGDRVVA